MAPQTLTKGCPTGTNFPCEVPLTCQSSTAFTPNFDGACLRPSANVTQVGKACSNSTECGSSVGSCRLPMMANTGTTLWFEGYCTQSCAPGQGPCPSGSACLTVDLPEGATDMCLQSCRVGFADCRPGYACADTSSGGVCVPRCQGNADCGGSGQYACRTCDGLCVAVNSQTELGDRCTTPETCGFGQSCIQLDNHGTHLCSSGCGDGCQMCPTGSSCHPLSLLGGQFFCLKNCSSGTCPSGLQCANLPTGRGCMPPCQGDTECPVGLTCNGGECGNPNLRDGGCGLLCQTEDSGTVVHPMPKDAGSGGGGSGGCGCNSSPASLLFGLMGLLFARSRPWRRRQ